MPQNVKDIIQGWDNDYKLLLNKDLSSNSTGAELKSLLASVENVEIWKYLKDDPAYAFELAKDNKDWKRWSKINFFKDITKIGHSFTKKVVEAMSDKNSALFKRFEAFVGRDLKDYELVTELPLETANGYMKADIALIKQDKITGRVNDVIKENKLNTTISYTQRQKEGFRAIINNKTHTMKVKYSRPNFNVDNSPTLIIKSDNIFRVDDHGTDNISNVNINRISNS